MPAPGLFQMPHKNPRHRVDRPHSYRALSGWLSKQRRRQRLVDSLEKLRRSRAGAHVSIRIDPASNTAALPAGVRFDCGTLRLEFHGVEDLLRKLYELSQAAADFEAFRTAAQGTPPMAIQSAGRAG